MPIIKSAKKRVRVANKASARNTRTKRSMRSAIKAFTASLKGEDARKAQGSLDTAVKKGVMHKNKAARKQRQLAAKAKAAGVKPAKSVKKATKQEAPKKLDTKKTPVKAASKATAKKKPVKAVSVKKTS